MSDAGADNQKISEPVQKKTSGVSDFCHAMAKIAVAQICESAGFQGFQKSALEILSDVAARYMHSLGETSSSYANSAGRTECNVFDILQGLEDLGSAQGFSGASDINHCTLKSGVVREIIQYVNEAKEIPFAIALPRFPVVRDRKLTPSFSQTGEEPPGLHIPKWLPTFPDPDTYTKTPMKDGGTVNPPNSFEQQRQHNYLKPPMHNERPLDPCTADNTDQAKQHENLERPSSVQPQVACNGSVGRIPVDLGDAGRGKQVSESNPFLAPPLVFGEREVSSVSLPVKLSDEAVAGMNAVENHVSVLEAFAPAIEAVKLGLSDAEEGHNKVFVNQRPTVHFKLGDIRKSSMGLSAQHKGGEKIGYWLGRESDKDDKKRRVEKILKESMENPQELAQL